MAERIPFEQVRGIALKQAFPLLRGWFPAGVLKGNEFCIGNLAGQRGDSLRFNIMTGQWSDFATGQRGGDLISLYAEMEGINQAQAAQKLQEILGIKTDTLDSAPPAQFTAPRQDWIPSLYPSSHASEPDLSAYDHVYEYCDVHGKLKHYVVRKNATSIQDKIVRPLTWGKLKDPNTGEYKEGWHFKRSANPQSLYGLQRLADPHRVVIVCEGEKAADAAQRLFPDYACLSWLGGTGSVAQADWSALQGRDVILWPDHDDAGQKAMRTVKTIISAQAKSVRMLTVDDLPPKGDAADLVVTDPQGWLQDHIQSVSTPEVIQPTVLAEPASRRAAKLDPIQVVNGQLDLVANAGEQALIQSGLPVFQRGGDLVRPGFTEVSASGGGVVKVATIEELNAVALTDQLCQAVEWQKWDGRKEAFRQIDPPPSVAQTILSRKGTWAFPSLASVVAAPTLRPDGSVLKKPGYDVQTRYYYMDQGLDVNCPDPTRDEAQHALALLQGLLAEFPLVSDVDHSVVLAAMLTVVCRGAIDVSPLFAFKATSMSSGKSYLIDLISLIAQGRDCPATPVGSSDEETEKRLNGLLIGGYPIISLDNVNGELGGDLLCQAVERPVVRLRKLGSSDMHDTECRSVIFANGNNLRVKGDMIRRTIMATLDPGVERPEQRHFKTNPKRMIMAARSKYIAACLTIVRSWLLSGDKVDIVPLASFEQWSRTVRSALIWLGCADPCDSMEAVREEDPELMDLKELIHSWVDCIGVNTPVTAREIEEKIIHRDATSYKLTYPDFHDVLMRIAGNGNNSLNARSFGRWLMNRRGRIVGDYVIDRSSQKDRSKSIRWLVRKI